MREVNILMLAAGAGSRFSKEGWSVPKPLLTVNNGPMFIHALQSLKIMNTCNYHFIFQQDVIENYNPSQYISFEHTIHSINGITDGAATTAYNVIKNDLNSSWLIIDCDFVIKSKNIILDDISGIFVEKFPYDTKASYSYVQDQNILCVAEKQLISTWRNAGLFYWNSGKLFEDCYLEMRNLDIKVNGEFYISPLYNIAIANNNPVKPIFIDKFIPIGTPKDLQEYRKVTNG